MNKWKKYFAQYKYQIIIVLFIIIGIFGYSIYQQMNEHEKASYSEFMDIIYDDEKVEDIEGELIVNEPSSTITYTYKDTTYEVQFPAGRLLVDNNKEESVMTRLEKTNAEIKITSLTSSSGTVTVFQIIYYLFIGLFAFYLLKMLGILGGFDVEKVVNEKTRFKDVAGYKYLKEEMQEIIDYIKNPLNYTKYIDDIPSHVLLEGPPGTGKTTLAKAIAGESNSVFYQFSASDIEDKYVGSGAKNIKKVFDSIRKHLKTNPKDKVVLFIDEIDAVGMKRENRTVQETGQTLNKLLTEMEGFSKNENIIIIAATNLVSQLDNALVSRFGKTIEVSLPNQKDREDVINLYLEKRGNVVSEEVFIENFPFTLAQRTHGFSNRDLNNLIKDASMIAKKKEDKIDIDCLRESLTKMIAGIQREHSITEEERKIIAYHEAGHATAQLVLNDKGIESVAYITITPYGKSLGHVAPIVHQQVLQRRTYIENDIKMALAGRAVEEKILDGDYTTGASNDLQQVNDKLKHYIATYGMSKEMENMYIGELNENAEFIQQKLHQLRTNFYHETRDLIDKHFDVVEKIAEHLLVYENINQHELHDILSDTTYHQPAQK